MTKNYEAYDKWQSWETFVGNQSAKDFMENSLNVTVREAVEYYSKECEFFKEITEDESFHIKSELEDYICDELGIGPNDKI
jgi:hypothetical protein